MTTVGDAFAAALRGERELFNEKFAEARRRRPDIDGRGFLEFLRGPAAAVVESAARVDPERARDVAHAAYDAGLTLVGEKLAGPGGRHPVIDDMWLRLLAALGRFVADDPSRVIGSLSNAVFHLAATQGARPADWIDHLLAVAPDFACTADLLQAGQVAAWRAGLAHLRAGALATADRLDPAIAGRLVGDGHDWRDLRDRLARDVWWDPSSPDQAVPRVTRTVGSFRGFGGLFVEPPRVAAADGRILVTAAGDCWELAADIFGATLHRVDPAAITRAAKSRDLEQAGGALRHRGAPLPIPAIGALTSAAAIPGTVAVTGDLTHAVTLLAVGDG
jgi:hypothetical protein